MDDCLKTGVIPLISWIHDEAERDGTDAQRSEYVAWGRAVAGRLRDRDHRLAFNLFTELGDYGDRFPGSLNRKPTKYNHRTRNAVTAIRAAGGRNSTRIIILGSPGKKGDELNLIDPAIYREDRYMMAEFHLYASGPNQKGGQKNWVGTGSSADRAKVARALAPALRFSRRSGIPTYSGRGCLGTTGVAA